MPPSSKVIWIDTAKIDGGDTSWYDREELIELLQALGIQPVKVEATEGRLRYAFLDSEVEPHKNELLCTTPIMVDYNAILSARNRWRNALTIMKTSNG